MSRELVTVRLWLLLVLLACAVFSRQAPSKEPVPSYLLHKESSYFEDSSLDPGWRFEPNLNEASHQPLSRYGCVADSWTPTEKEEMRAYSVVARVLDPAYFRVVVRKREDGYAYFVAVSEPELSSMETQIVGLFPAGSKVGFAYPRSSSQE